MNLAERITKLEAASPNGWSREDLIRFGFLLMEARTPGLGAGGHPVRTAEDWAWYREKCQEAGVDPVGGSVEEQAEYT